VISSSRKLGSSLGSMNQEQDDIKSNLSANEQDANAVIKTFENIKITGELTVTKRTIVGVLTAGHPVYGEVKAYPVFMPLVLGHPVWGLLGVGYMVGTGFVLPGTFPLTFDETAISFSTELLYNKNF